MSDDFLNQPQPQTQQNQAQTQAQAQNSPWQSSGSPGEPARPIRDMVNITGLWTEESASGGSYLTGRLNRDQVFKNPYGEQDVAYPSGIRFSVFRRRPKDNDDPNKDYPAYFLTIKLTEAAPGEEIEPDAPGRLSTVTGLWKKSTEKAGDFLRGTLSEERVYQAPRPNGEGSISITLAAGTRFNVFKRRPQKNDEPGRNYPHYTLTMAFPNPASEYNRRRNEGSHPAAAPQQPAPQAPSPADMSPSRGSEDENPQNIPF